MMHVNTDVQSEGKQRKTFSAMSNLHTDCCLKLDFEKLDQNRRSNCLIFGTKHRKDDQLQSLEHPIEYHSWEHKFHIKESDGCMLNLIYQKKVQGQKQPRGWAMAEPKIPNSKSKSSFKRNGHGHKHPSKDSNSMMKQDNNGNTSKESKIVIFNNRNSTHLKQS